MIEIVSLISRNGWNCLIPYGQCRDILSFFPRTQSDQTYSYSLVESVLGTITELVGFVFTSVSTSSRMVIGMSVNGVK